MAESSSQVFEISSPWLNTLVVSDLLRERHHCQRNSASFDPRYGHAARRFGRISQEQVSCSQAIYTLRLTAIEIPLGRLGRPEEIAETVIWMVKTEYVTNKVVGVDGGLFVQ